MAFVDTRDLAADDAMVRYGAGDDEAFELLYEQIAPRLYGFLFRRTKDAPRAEDLLQQTFLQIHRARGTFRPGASVMAWSFSIAHHLLVDEARKQKRQTTQGTSLTLASGEPSAEQILEAQEMSEALNAQLAQLPASQRSAFELIKLDGLTLLEAAQVLGTTVSAIKSLTHRAYKALRIVLDDGGTPQ